MATKPKAIEILTGTLTRSRVRATWTQGDGNFKLDEPDNPLPSLGKALTACAVVAAEIVHAEKAWGEGIRVVGFKMGTLGGSPTVVFHCKKSFDDTTEELVFDTPAKLLANPVEEGSYHPPLKKNRAELVEDLVEEFKKYVKGDRAQGTLPLEEEEKEKPAKPDPGANTGDLPMGDGAPAEGEADKAKAAKRRGKKSGK